MTESRIASRKRVLKSAFIILSDKAPKLECTIKNMSETGAMLQVSTTFGIPTTFDVIIDGQRRRSRAVWRTDTKLGVTFEK
jgi:PilZ domain